MPNNALATFFLVGVVPLIAMAFDRNFEKRMGRYYLVCLLLTMALSHFGVLCF